jgi:hypothetical protein
MSNTVKMKIDFYEVEKNDASFEKIARDVAALPEEDEQRNVLISGRPARLISFKETADLIEGDIVRIRMDNLPKKASLCGALEDLDLEDDEGIGEETAFMFIKKYSLLLLQRNRFGLTASAFSSYFEKLGSSENPIMLIPILPGDALLRLDKMQKITKFQVRVAGANNTNIIKENSDCGLSGILDLRKHFEAPYIDFSFSVGRKEQSLPIKIVKNVSRKIFNDPELSCNVSKLEITGKSDENMREKLDIIEDFVKCEQVVESGDNRSVSYQSRRQAIWASWLEKKTEVVNLLRGVENERI